MTERRDAAPDDGTTPPEDVPPAPDELAPETGDDVVEADIEEDITAPHETAAPVADATEAAATAAPTRRPMRPDERRASRQAAAPTSPRPAERVHIGDRASRLFVLASIATFALILLYGLLLGQGGLLSPDPSPTPAVSAAPSASPSGSPGTSASPSVSPSADTSESPSRSATSGSPSPS